MTRTEIQKYKKELPEFLIPVFVEDHIEDQYGVYETGFFRYKGKNILINKEDDLWHLSVSANHTLGYYELKEIRYKFMPNDMQVAQIFPPREDFVNIHKNCFHLFQILNDIDL